MTGADWDPFGTIRNALWIGGGQWAGKSTVARLLARRYGLTAYHYDYQDARGHNDLRIAARVRRGEPAEGPSADQAWLAGSPEQLAAATLASFEERFSWALDDLRARTAGRPVIAEGWGLRPDLVAPLIEAPDRMVVMVPTEEFRQYQTRVLPRAMRLGSRLSDPETGPAAAAGAGQAGHSGRRAHGAAVWHRGHRGGRRPGRGGSRDIVAGHFRPYLPISA